MSKEPNIPGSGRQGQSQPEIPPAQSPDSTLSTSHLTVETVDELQEDYPAAQPSLVRQSVEAYLQQGNLFGTDSEASRRGSKETDLPDEKEPEAASAGPLREEMAKKYTEPSEATSTQDFQTRPLTSSVPETRRCEFADLETQTEWSYSTTSLAFSGKARKTLVQDELEEQMEAMEGRRIMGKSEVETKEVTETWGLEFSSEDLISETLGPMLKSEDHSITDLCHLGCCEFCEAALHPIPTVEELENTPETIASVPCCRTYKDILECVMQELMESQSPEGVIDITPHPRLSQTMMNSRTKTHLTEELRVCGVESVKEMFKYVRYGPWTNLTITASNYRPEPVVIKKPPKPKKLLKIDKEFKPEQLKICLSAGPGHPVRRYYPDGSLFFLLLPDGTGQVYYPSGNIAILITYLKDVQFTYIILSDGPSNRLLAFFTNQGYASCYYPNGTTRVNLDLCCGFSYDQKGNRQKFWNWWDTTVHVHVPPWQPISIQFNTYIQVKIEAQDRIFLTFTKLHNCIHLNVGAKLKLKDPAMLSLLQSQGTWEPSVSQAKMQQIKMLLDNVREGLKTSCIPSQLTPRSHLNFIALTLSRLRHWQTKAHMRRENYPSTELRNAMAPARCGHD